MTPPPKFHRRPEEKVKRITKAFEVLVEKEGLDNITMKQIADTAEVSVGTIYKYFPEGKSDIVESLFESNVDDFVGDEEEFRDLFLLILKGQPEGIRLFVRKYYKNHLESYGNYKNLGVVLSNQGGIFQVFSQQTEFYIDHFLDDIKEEDLKLLPERAILKQSMLFMINTLEALVHHQIFNTRFIDDDEEFVNYLTNLLQTASEFVKDK